MIVTKNESKNSTAENLIEIPRIRHSERTEIITAQLEVVRYHGPKSPAMILSPSNVTRSDTEATKVLHNQAALSDMNFLKAVLCDDECPDNTQVEMKTIYSASQSKGN